MEVCLGHTTSVRQKTRSGEVANSATAEVNEVWPGGIHGDGVAQQPRVVLGLIVELCLVIHDPQHHSSWKLARWYVRTGRLG